MNCFLGVPAKPSGFPLYLFPLRSKRMPLQSLTHWRLLTPCRSLLTNKALPYPIFVSPLQGSLKNSQQSMVNSQHSEFKKRALENLIESKKNNKKAIHSQGLMKNVSALGVQNVTSQLLIKPMQK